MSQEEINNQEKVQPQEQNTGAEQTIKTKPKNAACITFGDKFKLQAGGWWALAFGAFICLLIFIFSMTKIILEYNLQCYQCIQCEKCGHVNTNVKPISIIKK